MSEKKLAKPHVKPIATAIGAAFATSMAYGATASANVNPFQVTELASGYQVAASHGEEGQCGAKTEKSKEGECGAKSQEQEKAGEGQCAANQEREKEKEGEGKCGEGKCGTG